METSYFTKTKRMGKKFLSKRVCSVYRLDKVGKLWYDKAYGSNGNIANGIEDVMNKNLSLQIQAVLYGNSRESLKRSLHSLANAVLVARGRGILGDVTLLWGDASPNPLFGEEEIAAWSAELSRTFGESAPTLRYVFFDENTGYGKGHNRLFSNASCDFLLILNPDIVVCHDFFEEMLAPFADETVGLTEARQTPVEHPKYYDERTGETYWSSGACFVMPAALYRTLGGFDDESFFMYCEDVDLSFRIRQTGKRLIYRPTAPVYHSRKFDTKDGSLMHTATELRHSAEAQMVFAYKWKFASMLRYVKGLCHDGNEYQRAALESFEKRLHGGKLRQIAGDTSTFKKQMDQHRFLM